MQIHTDAPSKTAFLAAGPGVWPRPASAATVVVQATESGSVNVFMPAVINAYVGDTVRWDFVGANPHTVTRSGSPESFDSGLPPLTTGSFEHTFTAAGSYDYTCLVHSEMDGTVNVLELPTSTPVPPTSTPDPNESPEPTDTPVTPTNTPEPGTATVAPPTPDAPLPPRPPDVTPGAVPSGQPAGASSLPRTGSGDHGDTPAWFAISSLLAAGGLLALTLAARRQA